jgi:EAL domain-containing protein (putative c-di-GMP-specific phosphodiesterase class I)
MIRTLRAIHMILGRHRTLGIVVAGPALMALCLLLLPNTLKILAAGPFLVCCYAARARGGPRASAAPIQTAISLPALEPVATIAPARTSHRHGVTGLETREPLIAQMDADGRGVLAIVAFTDFDRLCAFDPLLADRALAQFAARITRMVGDRHFIAHVDRSYFALWLGPDVFVGDAEAYLVAVRYALSDALEDDAGQLLPETRVSHGVYDPSSETASAALSRLLAACASGSLTSQTVDRVDQASSAAEREHYVLEQALRGALDRQEYHLCYQPQVDAATGLVSGAEALIRWDNPLRGLVSPAVFVPILEKSLLINEVGMFVLNAACRDARKWQRLSPNIVTVAVNLSGHQLEYADLGARIERTLDAHSLSPALLEIELTETAAAQDVSRVGRLFESLSRKGVQVAIDDFGTGYSSLSAIRKLSFGKIKIDREFVTEVDRRRESQAICQSIIALARGLGIRVLAEGVERWEEYAWLRRHGCAEFQGFYFSPPLDVESFEQFLTDQASLTHKLSMDPRALQQTINERLAG